MNGGQKIMLALLILAILFSVASIIINISNLDADFPLGKKGVSGNVVSPEGSTIGFFVEKAPEGEG
jgi:hypothetical protein